MPVRRTTASTAAAKPIEVAGYRLDAAAVAALGERARADGKVFSYSSLTEAAKVHDDGDGFLSLNELEKAYASIEPSRLPPQQGEKAPRSVLSALQRVWLTFKEKPAELSAHTADSSIPRICRHRWTRASRACSPTTAAGIPGSRRSSS